MSGARRSVLGCLLGGAIGDAFGGVLERGRLSLSDDTQMTLATCESIVVARGVDPAHLAATFGEWFSAHRFSGLGSSTLKALRDLQVGAHWALAGARGERAAGNGGAMRIAPLAFVLDAARDRQLVRDVVRITHHNDEAYLGALAILVALQHEEGARAAHLLDDVAETLPDCRVRDQLALVSSSARSLSLQDLATRHGCGGYVVESVPIALVAAQRILIEGFDSTLRELEEAGGDTDTIGSLAGQVAGATLGPEGLPGDRLAELPERDYVEAVAERFVACVKQLQSA